MTPHTYYIYSNINLSRKSAGATRMGYYAKALANDIDKVYLLSCSTNEISIENFNEISPNVYTQKDVSLTSGFFKSLFFIRKMNAFANKNSKNKTFILYPYPLIFLELLSIFYLKFFSRAKVFYEFNEIRRYSSSFHDSVSLKKVWYSIKKVTFITTFTVLEPLLYFFDGLICISTSIETYGKKYNKNTLRIPILTDPNAVSEKSNLIYATEGLFNIGFSGSIAPSKENLDDFIDVLKSARAQNYKISFNLCGMISDSYRKYLLDEQDVFPNINYYENLNNKELSTFLSQQDLLVIPRGYTLQNNFGFSTKLSDYLNHKKMILLTDISDNSLFIKDGVNGFIVPPNNNDKMLEKLVYIIENFEKLKNDIIDNASNTSKDKFHYAIFEEQMTTFLKVS
jgi:glycosyltransferase involved in cell wall biosynthesis